MAGIQGKCNDGAVQPTMFVVALRAGEYFTLWSWAGLWLAILGLFYLVSSGVTAPNPGAAILMTVAGIALAAASAATLGGVAFVTTQRTRRVLPAAGAN
jgi:drug/metabolite transporter (DMT)-like permease